MDKIKVYCLPYAGGSKSIFNNWIDEYKDVCEITPIEYSGHGSRFAEELYTSAKEVIDDIFQEIIADKPHNYVIFGHSMGSMIALGVVGKISAEYDELPKAVIIGGTRPPHLRYKDKPLGHLNKKELMDEFVSLGQIEPEIMGEPELVDILSDIFYADTQVGEDNTDYNQYAGTDVPVVVMTGVQDNEAPEEDMREWSKYFNGSFFFQKFDSDHFFPFVCSEFHTFFEKIIKAINNNEIH